MNTTGCPWMYSCNCISCISTMVSEDSCIRTCQEEGKAVTEGQCSDQCCASCNCSCVQFHSDRCQEECKAKGLTLDTGATDEFGCHACRCIRKDKSSGEKDDELQNRGEKYNKSSEFVCNIAHLIHPYSSGVSKGEIHTLCME